MKKASLIVLAIVFAWHQPSSASAPIRVVSLKPNITRTLIALGAGDRVTGTTRFCPRPNDAAIVVADYMNVDTETVVRLRPDLVLSSTENSRSRQYEILREAGLRVEIIAFDTLEDLFRSLERLGELLGEEDAARRTADTMRGDLDRARKIAEGRSGNFAVIVQRRPLIVAARNAYISTLFSAAGITNAFAANLIAYPVLDPEEILSARPGRIFDMSHGPGRGEDFLGLKVISIPPEDFLAEPGSVRNLARLLADG